MSMPMPLITFRWNSSGHKETFISQVFPYSCGCKYNTLDFYIAHILQELLHKVMQPKYYQKADFKKLKEVTVSK